MPVTPVSLGDYVLGGGEVAALVIAVLPVVPGFLRAATTPGGTVLDPDLFDRLYSYAWFVTFGVGFVAYLMLMRRPAR